jgi:aminopeptidase-like protein
MAIWIPVLLFVLLFFKGREAYIQAAPGLSLTQFQKKNTETLNKAQALLKALELAEEFQMILVLDNYDSFTYNLVQYLAEFAFLFNFPQ